MVEDEPRQIRGLNTALLRGVQAMVVMIVLGINWSALQSAFQSSVNSGSDALWGQLVAFLVSLGGAVVLTTLGVIYLHGKLLNIDWGRNREVRRLGVFHEMLAVIFACWLCWMLWPKLARSAYFGHHEMLSQLISFGLSILLAVVLVLLVWGVLYSLVLFKRTHVAASKDR